MYFFLKEKKKCKLKIKTVMNRVIYRSPINIYGREFIIYSIITKIKIKHYFFETIKNVYSSLGEVSFCWVR